MSARLRSRFGLLAAVIVSCTAVYGLSITRQLPGRALSPSQAARVFGGQTGGCVYFVDGASSYCANQNYSGCGNGACDVATGPNHSYAGGKASLVNADCSQLVCNGTKYICGAGGAYAKGCS